MKVDKLYDTGVIHGRFQVLHQDHLKYLLSGKALCHHLVVAITNPAPSQTRNEKSDENRGKEISNPLTFFERHNLVRAAMFEAGVPLEQFSIVPLPINFPDRYHFYVPMDATFFLTIYDDWGKRKQEYFKSLGLKVHILREVQPSEKGISGSQVRDLMQSGGPWEELVPPAVAKLCKAWDIPSRLEKLNSNNC